MSHHHDEIVVPRQALIAAGLLIALTVGAVGATQLTGGGKVYEPQTQAVETAALLFTDEADGVVAVFDAATGRRLLEYGPDEGAFVRVVMRGVARQRRMRGQGPETPVELTRREDGQIWLTDPESGAQFYLGAFGSDNSGAFQDILEREGAIRSVRNDGGA